MITLPSKDLVLAACAGSVRQPHPVLEAAHELAALHAAQTEASPVAMAESNSHRAILRQRIDRWVSSSMPPPLGAAYVHTETMGCVIDRLARFSVLAHAELAGGGKPWELHFAWHRLSEVSLGYGDLSHELGLGTRRLPDFTGHPD
ncbi:DUF4254 domain-containing protein [Nocardia cyriacigeorgica]|uniref:DUF4254 domain-containing protein n=1 Tax=Nocardia cyriacigeorgica TaxID=135487 RepID=A0A5R8NRZ6_9NOCA|nr:DUF4254 domain-containing protein [Nocardia cyriacigeorgica]TLF78472.1 DUF4254 domain-containing protein [Nocardia cyriacigeorgica]